jgi:hypothetical protein
LASFNFHVPIFALLAKLTAAAMKHRATVNRIVLVFMYLLIEKRIVQRMESAAILVVRGKFSNAQSLMRNR